MNEEVLIAFLLSYPGISALIGTRAYPYGLLPQKSGQITSHMPALVTSLISEQSHHSIDGETGRPALNAYHSMRFQVDIYGNSGADVWRVGDVIRDTIDGYSGTMGAWLVGGVFGRSATPVTFLPETKLYRRTMDYEIHAMG